jgi:hypothetical protein
VDIKRQMTNKFLRSFINLFPILGFIAITLFIFRHVLNLSSDKYIFGYDTRDHMFWLMSFFHQELVAGRIPFWDPYITSGYPFSALIPIFYPFLILFYLFEVPKAFVWFYIIHIIFAMIGGYYLCRKWCNKLASFASGIIFGLSGIFFPHIYSGSSVTIASSAYTPYIVKLFLDITESNNYRKILSKIILSSILITLCFLAGDQKTVIFTLIICGVITLINTLRFKLFAPIIYLLITLIFSFGLMSFQLLPSIELALNSQRSTGLSYGWSSGGAINISHLPELFLTITHKIKYDQSVYTQFIENPFTTGVIPLILTGFLLITIITSYKRKKSQYIHKYITPSIIFGVLSLLSIWISFGPNSPIDLYYILWKFIPFMNFLRWPARFTFIFIFGISVLSGLSLSVIKRKNIQIVIISLLIIELVPFAEIFIKIDDIPPLSHDDQLIKLLTAKDVLFRVHPNYYYAERLGNATDMNAPDYYRYFSTNGYTSLLLKNYAEYYSTILTFYNTQKGNGLNQIQPVVYTTYGQGFDFLNVRYLLQNSDMNPNLTDLPEKYQLALDNPSRWFRVYSNSQAFPRFFLVQNSVSYPNRIDAMEALGSENHDLSNTVIYVNSKLNQKNENTIPCSMDNLGNIELKSYLPSQIELNTDSTCDSIFVSSEVMYPGWKASIDGHETQIKEGNLAFRSFNLPKGKHQILMKYTPNIYLLGAFLSCATLLVMMIWYLLIQKNTQKNKEILT